MKLQVSATRMELLRLKKRLVVAKRGHKLLKDKFDELMRKFMELIKGYKALHLEVEDGINRAYSYFITARAHIPLRELVSSLTPPKEKKMIHWINGGCNNANPIAMARHNPMVHREANFMLSFDIFGLSSLRRFLAILEVIMIAIAATVV